MTAEKTKLQHLQGLRGIAIIAVVSFHFFPEYCKNGYLGVDIFFLISGYLMTMMLDRVETVSLPGLIDFWYRRFKRILPFYYLVIFVIIIVLFFYDGMIRNANMDSGFSAVILATNLIRPDKDVGYFEKLGVAVDLFTHTWSLALETQFYALFPFLFIFIKALPCRVKVPTTVLLGLVSLLFHICSDSFNGFNSVFSRIWQFLGGTAAFYVEDWFGTDGTRKGDDEEESLIEPNSGPPSSNSVFINTTIFALFVLLVIPQEVSSLYARINSIIICFVIVTYGKKSCLENRFLAFIGEISYGWYLVHWPIYAVLKIHKLTEFTNLLDGILISFLLAVVLHYFFEKPYLSWSKVTVITTVLILSIASGSSILYMKGMVKLDVIKVPPSNSTVAPEIPSGLDSRFYYTSDFLENVVYGYENMTVEERIELNQKYAAEDLPRTFAYCKHWIKTSNPMEARCEMNYMANKTANATLLLLGNSWAGNIMQPLVESCSHRFSHLETVYQGACESLFRSPPGDKWRCELDYMFLDAVKRVQPDVLILFNRYLFSSKLTDGTTPFNDIAFKEGVERLNEYQKYVKKTIFILDAFPTISPNVTNKMNAKLKAKVAPEEEDATFDLDYFTVKQRISRVISGCKKCKLFDISTQFWFNGKFLLHDPKYLISFTVPGLHLTPAAWARVKPLLKHICDIS